MHCKKDEDALHFGNLFILSILISLYVAWFVFKDEQKKASISYFLDVCKRIF